VDSLTVLLIQRGARVFGICVLAKQMEELWGIQQFLQHGLAEILQ
jgi:hypothetical protein